MAAAPLDVPLLESIAKTTFAQTVAMIHAANHRADAAKTDPKVGGHPASCASSLEILAALHLVVRDAGDFVAGKPHAAPIDHALHHQLGLFRHPDGRWFDDAEGEALMGRLRAFPRDGTPVFQSYHAESDPDSFGFLPTGSVGIPAVAAAYLSLAHRYARQHGEAVGDPQFWCLMGDSEFREGSLLEALPEVAERELGNVTWIVDYNRQNLDGTRIPNHRGLNGTDADRIERTAVANGWRVVQLRHGRAREALFARPGGELLRAVFERGFTDYHFQAQLWKRDPAAMRQALLAQEPRCRALVGALTDAEVRELFFDLGGHDLHALIGALQECRRDPHRPTLIVAHTVKGRGLSCAAANGNHSAQPETGEVHDLLAAAGLSPERPFARFPADSAAGRFLAARGGALRRGIEAELRSREARRAEVGARIQSHGGLPDALDIPTKLAPVTHTQWMWGQLAAKLVRIGVYDELALAGKEQKAGKELTPAEQQWAPLADLMMTMAPDVGTSTNVNPAMDEKIFGPKHEENWEAKLELHERLRPELAPTDEAWTRHIRFEIAEANCMTALGSFGRMDALAGVPFLPLMTIYDFFVKRALDQLYYDLYLGSSFVLVGTPSGVTLSPEGAQHSWKSDLQIPNLITWEPAFVVEMEWILCDAIRRHFARDQQGRSGVLIRAVTRSLHQNQLLEWLRRQARWKRQLPAGAELGLTGADGGLLEASVPAVDDAGILAGLRDHVLAGGYRLIDWRGYRGHAPGENVVELFVMGALVPEAIAAAELLLDRGIHANVTVVTSPDLLCGELGRRTSHRHLRETLGVTGELHLRPAGGGAGPLGVADAIDLAGRRVPIVSVHDGEPGLLDNLGSVVGVPQFPRAVVKFSKSGTPADVYRYHGLDAAGIAEACGEALARTALERVRLHPDALSTLQRPGDSPADWRTLWPSPS